jgi:ergothioneine biosynthesis protein EgtB
MRKPAIEAAADATSERDRLRQAFKAVRAHSLALTAPLSDEDQCVQSMPDASPTKWHLAHTSWFFETVVLRPYAQGYRPFDERYAFLFNSYYESLGPRHPRPQRGLLTRPSADEIRGYRAHVDAGVLDAIDTADEVTWQRVVPLLTLGLHHEQQHQELILTDVKHLLSLNSLQPAALPVPRGEGDELAPGLHPAPLCSSPLQWHARPDGVAQVGADGVRGFAFDNEMPRHRVLLRAHRLACRPVNCAEYLEFVRDGGYRKSTLWLSDGWAAVQSQGWTAPLYWSSLEAEHPTLFTLHGPRQLDPREPVCHLSFYEAAAYAEWAGARLPTEFEWEAAAEAGALDATGEVWEWTRSSYDPYPGFRPMAGAVGEYNGKFMVGQLVLRGGSCASPPGHTRSSYRNFFPPAARWQFSGLRLARDDA